MTPLFKEIRHSLLLWMLVFVPVVLAVEFAAPSAHTAFRKFSICFSWPAGYKMAEVRLYGL